MSPSAIDRNAASGVRRIVFTGTTIVALTAAVKLLLHLYAGRRYGFFVDELYFVAMSDHLAWGYVDAPPLIAAMVKLTRLLFGDSLQSIRLFAALAGAANILLAGRIARELGGGRFAQGLCAVSVLVASANLSMNHYMSMNAFEPLFWMGCALVVIRIVNTGNRKLWLWVGPITGIGWNNKYSMAFFCLGLAVGLLLTPQRRAFLGLWFWLAALLAFLLGLPNLIWNVQHHFPFLELMANIRRSGLNPVFTPTQFLAVQLLFLLPMTLPVWLSGLIGSSSARRNTVPSPWIRIPGGPCHHVFAEREALLSAARVSHADGRRSRGAGELALPPTAAMGQTRVYHHSAVIRH